MAAFKTTATIRLKNYKAVNALAFAAQVLADAHESAPWNGDLLKAAKAIRFAVNKLTLDFGKKR